MNDKLRNLNCFSVSPNCQAIYNKCIHYGFGKLRPNIHKTGAFEHNHPQHFNKILSGVKFSNQLCPLRHAFNRGKQATH